MSDQNEKNKTQKITLPPKAESKPEAKPEAAKPQVEAKVKETKPTSAKPPSGPKPPEVAQRQPKAQGGENPVGSIIAIICGVALALVLIILAFSALYGRSSAKKSTEEKLRQELSALRQERDNAAVENRRRIEEETAQVTKPEVVVPSQQPKEIRRVAPGPGHIGEPKAPPVLRWISNNGYLVPVRQMPDGVAGYGETYSRPPTGGALPQEDWAKPIAKSGGNGWTRNERGDWAIPLR